MEFFEYEKTVVVTDDLSKACGHNYADLEGVPGATWDEGHTYATRSDYCTYLFEDFSSGMMVEGNLQAVACAAYIWALESGAVDRPG